VDKWTQKRLEEGKEKREVKNEEERNEEDGNQKIKRRTREEGIRNVRRKVRNGEEDELGTGRKLS
jgi:hypothetical protein